MLASLAGKGTYNRVLKLRSPFGGGKSHTLASLLHAARSRKSLNQIAACKGMADPGPVDVAVFDGEKFTATGDKDVGKGQLIHTRWGWLGWQLGPKAFKVVQKHDADRVSPSGDEIKAMLEANGRPALLLLDEVLKYMERAAAVGVKDSTLQRQAKDFIQNLTVEVSNSTNAVMVYSLQWSAREALGNVALLEELDKLTSRKDQVREPVTGDEVLAALARAATALGGPINTDIRECLVQCRPALPALRASENKDRIAFARWVTRELRRKPVKQVEEPDEDVPAADAPAETPAETPAKES